MIYQSLEYTLSNHEMSVHDYKVLTRIVEAMQKHISKAPANYTRYITPPAKLLIMDIPIKQLTRDCGTDYSYNIRTILHMKYVKIVTPSGRKITPLISFKRLERSSVLLGINPEFFKLLFNWKSGVCSYPRDIAFNFTNYFSIKLFQLLYNRGRLNISGDQLRHMLNCEHIYNPSYMLVNRALITPQKHYAKIGLCGFYYSVNYRRKSWPRKINSVSFKSRFLETVEA